MCTCFSVTCHAPSLVVLVAHQLLSMLAVAAAGVRNWEVHPEGARAISSQRCSFNGAGPAGVKEPGRAEGGQICPGAPVNARAFAPPPPLLPHQRVGSTFPSPEALLP